ncbi:hypothetical protein BC830DRAFT_398021 [Chytriomyces sp. MP71]|nr:hypothetical protein BC830DRAFT_398021 [Chytriomyces sp. MP71]
MGVSRTLHFGQSYASAASSVQERLRSVFNAGGDSGAWVRVVRKHLPVETVDEGAAVVRETHDTNAMLNTTRSLLTLSVNSASASTLNAFALATHAASGACVFVATESNAELDAIVAKLKAVWALRQTLRVDGSQYAMPNAGVTVRIGSVTVGTSSKGVLIEVEADTDDEAEGVTLIKATLKKLFRNVDKFSAWDVEKNVPATYDYGGVEWLRNEEFGVSHSSFAIMKLCTKLIK